MWTTITLVVSLCSQTPMSQVQAKLKALEAQNPGSRVSLRMDKKCKGPPKARNSRKALKASKLSAPEGLEAEVSNDTE